MTATNDDVIYNSQQLGGVSYRKSWLDRQAINLDWRPDDWYQKLCNRYRMADIDTLEGLTRREMAHDIVDRFVNYDSGEEIADGDDCNWLHMLLVDEYHMPDDFACSDTYPAIVGDLARTDPHWLKEMWILTRGDFSRCYPTPWTYATPVETEEVALETTSS